MIKKYFVLPLPNSMLGVAQSRWRPMAFDDVTIVLPIYKGVVIASTSSRHDCRHLISCFEPCDLAIRRQEHEGKHGPSPFRKNKGEQERPISRG